MSPVGRVVTTLIVLLVASPLAACGTTAEAPHLDAVTNRTIVTDHVVEAQGQFMHGDFGLAEHSYRAAVESDPQNAEAWLGLAACYDELRRFDLADKAYSRVKKLLGETPAVLNNIGYSYLLRGDLDKARDFIETAYERSPDDPTIRNNLERLKARLSGRAG